MHTYELENTIVNSLKIMNNYLPITVFFMFSYNSMIFIQKIDNSKVKN